MNRAMFAMAFGCVVAAVGACRIGWGSEGGEAATGEPNDLVVDRAYVRYALTGERDACVRFTGREGPASAAIARLADLSIAWDPRRWRISCNFARHLLNNDKDTELWKDVRAVDVLALVDSLLEAALPTARLLSEEDDRLAESLKDSVLRFALRRWRAGPDAAAAEDWSTDSVRTFLARIVGLERLLSAALSAETTKAVRRRMLAALLISDHWFAQRLGGESPSKMGQPGDLGAVPRFLTALQDEAKDQKFAAAVRRLVRAEYTEGLRGAFNDLIISGEARRWVAFCKGLAGADGATAGDRKEIGRMVEELGASRAATKRLILQKGIPKLEARLKAGKFRSLLEERLVRECLSRLKHPPEGEYLLDVYQRYNYQAWLSGYPWDTLRDLVYPAHVDKGG